MGETIGRLRAAKKGGKEWIKETDGWFERLFMELRDATRKNDDLRLKHAKPRLKAPRGLWIEVLTNRPVEDLTLNRWGQMKIEVGPRYTMKEIYQKVRSRWKD
jgi:hypothetical protein